MAVPRTKIPIKSTIPGARYIGIWKGDSSVRIFDIYDTDGLNSIIGLAKHRNSNGTVLYRGQCNLYEHLVPSIMHDTSTLSTNREALTKALDAMCKDNDIAGLFEWSNEVNGWELYIRNALEASLQHYGAKTRCVDFVDNHWTALWFALNEYDSTTGHYNRRSPGEPSSDSDQWISFKYDKMKNDGHSYGYVILYLADTNVSEVNGLYLGDRTYTVDLRKALPPTFLRPGSQHGWTVSAKERKASKAEEDTDPRQYYFDSKVVGILRISTDLISKMLGNGDLLSQKNFFPSPSIDKGYSELLSLPDSILHGVKLEEYHNS